MSTFFSDRFEIDGTAVDDYGAFDISLIADLPLFIDPFLLFNSDKPEYQLLHDELIRYLVFLREKAKKGSVSEALLRAWYCFPEVKQTWLGFSLEGNQGSGLGIDFAYALHENLHHIFGDFGAEKITKSSHIEKVCLIKDGIGRDHISDFVTNLIKDYLCTYTQEFAQQALLPKQRRAVAITGAVFNYETETWQSKTYSLPWTNGDFVLLTPKDMLTRDETWINRRDLIRGFEEIPQAIPDDQLRAQVSNYFERMLARPADKEPTQRDYDAAALRTIREFPDLIDYYIRLKEERGDEAIDISSEKVRFTQLVFVDQLREIQRLLENTAYYSTASNTYQEAHQRLAYLKDVIENKGGHRLFYSGDTPIKRESDLQILYRLVWFGTPSDVSREVNDGRGPADFKISRGAKDKTIVELKLARNTHLRRNLEKQAEIYEKASDARHAIKGILFFTSEEEQRAAEILTELGMLDSPDIVLIDARSDNKPSGSKA